MSSSGLGKKRSDALGAILTTAAMTGAANALPTPAVEELKQLAIAAADFGLCVKIGTVYFQDSLTDWTRKDTLRALGGVGVGAVLIYGGVKLADGMAAEFLNFVPPVGWVVSGCTAAASTLTVGLVFWLACDRSMRHQRDVGDELAEIRREFAEWKQGGSAPKGLVDLKPGNEVTRFAAQPVENPRARPVNPNRLAVHDGRLSDMTQRTGTSAVPNPRARPTYPGRLPVTVDMGA